MVCKSFAKNTVPPCLPPRHTLFRNMTTLVCDASRVTELVDEDIRYMADPDNALLLMNVMALGPSTSALALTAMAPP